MIVSSIVIFGTIAIFRFFYIYTVPFAMNAGLASLYFGAAFLLSGAYLAFRNGDVRAVALLNGYGLLAVGVFSAMAASCVVFYTGRAYPLVDSNLNAIDLMLGLDWVAYMRIFEHYPRLEAVVRFAYETIHLQPLLIIPILAFSNELKRLYIFLYSMNLSFCVICLVAIFFPAFGAYEYLGLIAADHIGIDLIHREKMTQPILWMREAVFNTPFRSDVGLISFPSFHAALGAINIWACWGVRFARWPALALNVLMIAGTPVHGSHYFVDVFAGILLSLLAIFASSWAVQRLCASSGRFLATGRLARY